MLAKPALPLTIKVNLIITVTLVLGVGALALSMTLSSWQTNAEANDLALQRHSRSIYAAIETIMLPGQAELASGLFSRYMADSGVTIRVFRADGTEAFVDNATVRNVNQRLGEMRFRERSNPAEPRSVLERELFAQAATHPELEALPFTAEGPDRRVEARLYKSLINIPKCTACHGSDHTVRGVLDIRFDVTRTLEQQRSTLWVALVLFVLTVLATALFLAFYMRRSVIQPVTRIGSVCDTVSRGDFTIRAPQGAGDELGRLARRVNDMIAGLEERFKLAKYVSGSTIKSLGQDQEAGQKVHRVLLFSDIRGFTSYSDQTPPEQVVTTLNGILNVQTAIIHEFQGDIDKYVGDEVVAVFEGPDAVFQAFDSALAIRRSLADPGKNPSGLQVGMGIHAGPVIHGMVGSQVRADFTVIGDTVNTTARLCAAAPAREILASREAVLLLRSQREAARRYRLEGPYSLRLKGKARAQQAFKLREAETP